MHNFEILNENNISINDSCTIILKNNSINIEYDFNDGNYNVLVFNDNNSDVYLNETGNITNAKVNINYLQLDSYNLKQNTTINVNTDSSLIINTTFLGTNNKEIIFNLINNNINSSVDINNNVVCINNSDFSLDVIGTIVRGAKQSRCHQKNHCLTINSPKKARILPILNIDENDVEASHSLSCGTMDEDVLFYINSRGLTKQEALNLVLRSYLMPSDEYYFNFDNSKLIQDKAIKKVDQICLM